MKKMIPLLILLLIALLIFGCDKEKIVTTTETVKEIEYIESPPDTITITDTIFRTDTTVTNSSDTVYLTETEYIHDTVIVTETVVDTINTIHNIYDTITVIVTVVDTVEVPTSTPNEINAYSAMQYHTDPAVLELINAEFGYTDGWVLYLSNFQNDVANPSTGVFEFYGVIDYWTADFSGYYPLEYYWRVSFTGGDPTNPLNWQLSDPPTAVNGKNSGLQIIQNHSSSVMNR